VRRHAKASSAGSISSRGSRLGSIRRGALATRASSPSADGSGASSTAHLARSRAFALPFGVALLATLVLVAGAAASKNVFTWIGTTSSGSLGGQLNTPQGVAVNNTGTGGASAGDIYVADSSNNRVDVFSSAGAFKFAFGQDVVSTGTDNAGTGFEVCKANPPSDDVCKAGITSVSPAPGGEMSLPQGIAINQSDGSIYVSDRGFIRVQKFSATGAFQAAWGQDVVNAGTGNNPAQPAKQSLTVDAAAGQFKLTFKGQTTGDLNYNDPPATIQTALQGLSTIGAGNATVTGGADCTAACTIAFASALNNSPQPLLTSSNGTTPLSGGTTSTAIIASTQTGSSGFEVCTPASTSCKTGVTGATAGAFASTFSGYLAVAPAGSPNAGDVLVADPANRRVQEFDSSGAFVRAFGFDVAATPTGSGTSFEVCSAAGFDVCKIAAASGSGSGQFANNTPTRIAEDSTGAIYTVEPATNFRVQQFTLPANVPTPQGAYVGASLTGTAATSTPTDVQIGAANHLYVVKAFTAGTGTPPATSAERRILEIDPTLNAGAGGLADTHMAGAAINSVNGLGVDGAAGRLLVSSTTSGHRVYMLDNPISPPALVVNDITTKTDTTATFTGTVDPQGGNVSGCKFQYSTDPSFSGATTVNENGCDSLAIGGGAQAVGESVTGLLPNTHYYVRLQASRPFVPNSTVTSFTKSFDTDSVPPVLTDPGATEVSDTSARLVVTIDPRNSATGYVFEYGTTPALGSSTAPLNIGGGTTPITVSQVVSGLAKDTDYWFRAVATNAFGSTASTQATFHTRAAPLPLPEDRAYEQVTPPDKNAGDASPVAFQALAHSAALAPGGDAAAFCTTSLFGEPANQLSKVCSPYVTRRTADGWRTLNPLPHYCPNDARTGGTYFYIGSPVVFPSPDFSHAAFDMYEYPGDCAVLDPTVASPSINLYRTDLGADPLAYDRLQPNGRDIFGDTLPKFLGSDDFGSIDFEGIGNQTADSPVGNFKKLYQWEQPGHDACSASSAAYDASLAACLSLISRDPGGFPFTGSARVPSWSTLGGNARDVASSVSADGNRAYFLANPASTNTGDGPEECLASEIACQVYLRESPDRQQSPLVNGSAGGATGELTAGSTAVANVTAPTAGAFAVGQTIASPAAISGHVTIAGCTPNCAAPTGLTLSAPAYASQAGAPLSAYSECADASRACTFPVSASECSASCGVPQPANFLAADSAGDVALFATCAKLTDASSASGSCGPIGPETDEPKGKLYRWDRDAAPGHRLIDLTADHEPADGSNPGFLGQLGMSDDAAAAGADAAPGNTVYFVARGQLVAGAPTFPFNYQSTKPSSGAKLYRWRWNGGDPTVDYLGPYTTFRFGGSSQSDIEYNLSEQRRRVTPDGRYLVIDSALALDPAVDRDADIDVYRWSQAEGWRCASCQLPGAASMGPADAGGQQEMTNPYFWELVSYEPAITLSDDGRVFFQSADSLLPADVNAPGCTHKDEFYFDLALSCQDVYEWDDGTLSLLSAGTPTSDGNVLVGSTPSGRDVLFYTRDKLVGWDKDGNMDIYDARVNGGFPEPPPRPPACDLDAGACEGPATVAPNVPGAGSAAFQGPGDPPAKHKQAKKKHHKKRKHKAKHRRRHHRAHRRAANDHRRAAR
jgi:hypothetical protein